MIFQVGLACVAAPVFSFSFCECVFSFSEWKFRIELRKNWQRKQTSGQRLGMYGEGFPTAEVVVDS